MLVGVLSDTHGTLPPAAYAELADCDHVVHAGDIGAPDILAQLRALAPTTAVLGNNDYDEYGSDVQRYAAFTVGGVRFLMAHTPDDLRNALCGRTSALAPGDPVPAVAIHGHTHVPRLVTGAPARPAAWLVCPGSVTRPRGGSKRSLAKIVIEDGRVRDIRFVELTTGLF